MAEGSKCVVDYCCCGCDLRKGTLAIGIINIIFALIQIIMIAIGLSVFLKSVELWLALVLVVLYFIINCVLVNGVRQESRAQVMTWVWVTGIFVVLSLINWIVIIAQGAPILKNLSAPISCAINIYFMIVVRSLAIKTLTPGSMA